MNIDPQLLESVQRALEQDGLLQSIKAKIRSNVARIIKDSGDHQNYTSPKLKLINSADGKIALLVVKELLQKLNLTETLLVFEAEASLENSKENDIENIWQALSLTDRRSTLLENLLQSRKEYLEGGVRRPTADSLKSIYPPVLSSVKNTVATVASPQQAKTTSVESPLTSPARSKLSPVKAVSPRVTSEDKYYREANDAKLVPVDAGEVTEEVEDFEEDFEEADGVEKSSSFAHENSPIKSSISSYAKDFKANQFVDDNLTVVVTSPSISKPSAMDSKDDNDEVDSRFDNSRPTKAVAKSPKLSPSVSPKASTLMSLPEVKPSGHFQFRSGEVLEPETVKNESFDDGPEVDSEIEEEEDFSQLDQDVEVSQSLVPALSRKFNSNDDYSVDAENSNMRKIVVTGSNSPSNAVHSRAQVTRLEGSNVTRRSTRGWDLPTEDNEPFEQSRDDNEDALHQSYDGQGNATSRVVASLYGANVVSVRSQISKGRDDDDYRAHEENISVGDNSFEDSNNSSIDQTHSSPLARGPGRRQYPMRSSPSPGRPTRSSHHSISTSAFANLNDSEVSHGQVDLAQSYRSNQDDEDDDDHRQHQKQWEQQQGGNRSHLYNDAEDLEVKEEEEDSYDEDKYEDDDYDDDDKNASPPAAGTSLFSRKNNITANMPNKAAERSELNQNHHVELDDTEDGDEAYGDEDFEQDEEDNRSKSFSKSIPSNIASAAVRAKPAEKPSVPVDGDIEEIEEEEEVEEELSIGQASDDDNDNNSDDGGWMPNKRNTSAPSLGRQTSGTLPTVQSPGRYDRQGAGTQRGRHNFSAALNDFDSDEDDALLPAHGISSNNTNSNGTSNNKNNNTRTAYGPEISVDGEDSSVASENVSIGDDNHSDSESF